MVGILAKLDTVCRYKIDTATCTSGFAQTDIQIHNKRPAIAGPSPNHDAYYGPRPVMEQTATNKLHRMLDVQYGDAISNLTAVATFLVPC